MKIKLALAAALLVCQVLTASALALGQPGASTLPAGSGPRHLVAQADMDMGNTYTGANAGSNGGTEATAAPAGKAKHKRTGRGGKHKHAFRGRTKHRLSSGLRCPPQDEAVSEGNTCCATVSSGM